MTHDEIESAIGRLCAIEPSDYVGSAESVAKVVRGFMGGAASGEELRDVLVVLLRQADPDMHITLPVGADGGVIRIGDMAEHCYNGRWGKPFEVVEMWLRPSGWMVRGENGAAVIVETCRRHNKPTVEDVLTEMLEKAVGFSDAHTAVALGTIAVYAAKIREATEDE